MLPLRYGACVSNQISVEPIFLKRLFCNGSIDIPLKYKIKAKRIILIRHAESLGNEDETTYVHTPDWKIGLTDKGQMQASEAGVKLRDLIGPDESVYFYVSPYVRTQETLRGIKAQLQPQQIWGTREEPRIAEQQFGNFQV